MLYPYQRRWVQDQSRFKIACWARQTGKTTTTTLEAVLDCLDGEAEGRPRRWTILSSKQERARDAIDIARRHLEALRIGFRALETPLPAEERAYELILPGGSRIRASPANPSTARGLTESLILDEFAHHRDDRAIWTALFPSVSRGDLKLRVISTPNGRNNLFYELMCAEEHAQTWSRHRIDIYQAVADGLDRNIDELRRGIGDPVAWAQEYECVFVDEATAWLPLDLITACEHPDAGEPALYRRGLCYVGMDIAARGDLTVIAVLEDVDRVLWCRELIELRREPFAVQLGELDRVVRSYRVARIAVDQTGMGEMPVEEIARRHGSHRVEGVLLTAARKLDLAGQLRQRLEARTLVIPPRRELRADLHAVQRVVGPTGAPRLVAERTDDGHADRFWALALACGAAYHPSAELSAWSSTGTRPVARLTDPVATSTGWGTVRRRA